MKRNRVIDAEFFYGATPEIFLRASELRKNMTLAEKLLWRKINCKKLLGLTFRRQHPINQFIANFYCHQTRLVIEIDGSIHDIVDSKLRDIGREHEFEKFGLTTIRFRNEDVIDDISMVINKIASVCQLKVPHLKDSPLPASPIGEV
jgi:very-short-patch-repair endonuclease